MHIKKKKEGFIHIRFVCDSTVMMKFEQYQEGRKESFHLCEYEDDAYEVLRLSMNNNSNSLFPLFLIVIPISLHYQTETKL